MTCRSYFMFCVATYAQVAGGKRPDATNDWPRALPPWPRANAVLAERTIDIRGSQDAARSLAKNAA